MTDLNRYVLPDQGIDVEVFEPPSREAAWLTRKLEWLVAPEDGRGNVVSRAFGAIVVAPFTQLSIVSFDLNCFLFEVFHRKIWARIGHGVFMVVVNFAIMMGLSQFMLAAHPVERTVVLPPNLGQAYALLLIVWYFAIAAKVRLWAWWAIAAPLVAALAMAANAAYGLSFVQEVGARTWFAPTPLVFNPWLWMLVGAFLVAASHVPETYLPPRVTETKYWRSVRDYALATGEPVRGVRVTARRLVRMVFTIVWGTLDELWASPRLMPYNLLMLMFRAGYRPEIWKKIQSHTERAWASGNPAIDFVGIGGGAFLDAREVARSGSDARR